METFKTYVAIKRYRKKGIGGDFNIPYGSALTCEGDIIFYKDRPVCYVTSEDAKNWFTQDDDGCGKERGALTERITKLLTKRYKNGKQLLEYQQRWDLVWADSICKKYRMLGHDDHWLWSSDFFNAGISDLEYIANLVGA